MPPIEEKTTPIFDPDKVRQTKTYSISMGNVARVKEMSLFLDMPDGRVLDDAVMNIYGKVFPGSADEVKPFEPDAKNPQTARHTFKIGDVIIETTIYATEQDYLAAKERR